MVWGGPVCRLIPSIFLFYPHGFLLCVLWVYSIPVKFMSASCQPHCMDSSRPLWHKSWAGCQHLASLPPLTTLRFFPVGTTIVYMSHLVKCDKVVKECLKDVLRAFENRPHIGKEKKFRKHSLYLWMWEVWGGTGCLPLLTVEKWRHRER